MVYDGPDLIDEHHRCDEERNESHNSQPARFGAVFLNPVSQFDTGLFAEDRNRKFGNQVEKRLFAVDNLS